MELRFSRLEPPQLTPHESQEDFTSNLASQPPTLRRQSPQPPPNPFVTQEQPRTVHRLKVHACSYEQPPLPTPQYESLSTAARAALQDTSKPLYARDRHELQTLLGIADALHDNFPEVALSLTLKRLQTLLRAKHTTWSYARAVQDCESARATGLFTKPPRPPDRPSYRSSTRARS